VQLTARLNVANATILQSQSTKAQKLLLLGSVPS
jgi:hypothetical protein